MHIFFSVIIYYEMKLLEMEVSLNGNGNKSKETLMSKYIKVTLVVIMYW